MRPSSCLFYISFLFTLSPSFTYGQTWPGGPLEPSYIAVDGKLVLEIAQPNETTVLKTGDKAILQLAVLHREPDPMGVIDVKLRKITEPEDDLPARYWGLKINGGSRSLIQMALAGKELDWTVHQELVTGRYQILVEIPGKTADAKPQKLTSETFTIKNENKPIVLEGLESNTTTTETSKPTQTGGSNSSLPNESNPSDSPSGSLDDPKGPNPTIIGVAIACAVVGVSLVVLAIIVLVRRARRQRERAAWSEPYAELGGDAEFKRAVGELEADGVKYTPEMDGREVVVYELDHTRAERPVEMPTSRNSLLK